MTRRMWGRESVYVSWMVGGCAKEARGVLEPGVEREVLRRAQDIQV